MTQRVHVKKKKSLFKFPQSGIEVESSITDSC